MLATGSKIISKKEIQKLLDRRDKTATIGDAIQTRFNIVDSFYYQYHSIGWENRYKIIYVVEVPFSES